MKWKQRGAALLLALVFVFTTIQGAALAAGEDLSGGLSREEVLDLLEESQEPEAETAISRDRDEGIKQIQTVIPDPVFAAAVYDALYADEHLGTAGDTVKDVLSSFTGSIDANGYVKKTTYTATVIKVCLDPDNFSTETLIEVFDSQEEAQTWKDSFVELNDGYTYSTTTPIKVETVQTTEQKPESELIHSIEGIVWLRQAAKIDIAYNAISDFTPLSKEAIEEALAELGDYTGYSYQKWFGTPGKNTDILIEENPLAEYSHISGGRINFSNFQAEIV